jgi:hypothetical protein
MLAVAGAQFQVAESPIIAEVKRKLGRAIALVASSQCVSWAYTSAIDRQARKPKPKASSKRLDVKGKWINEI